MNHIHLKTLYPGFKDLSSVRLFYGIPVPESIHDLIEKISSSDPGMKWIKGNNLHITLVFLGNIDPAQASRLMEIECPQPSSFEITVEKAEIRNKHKGGLIWLKCSATPGIKLLKHQLTETLSSAINFKEEDRPYNPHITIARSRRKILAEIPSIPSLTFTPSSYNLYQTIQGDPSLKYKVIREMPLNTKAPLQ